MPWPWTLALDCLDMQAGRVLHWPVQGDWGDNQFLCEAMRRVWRVVKLFHKPRTRTGKGGVVEANWDENDISLYDWLNRNAWQTSDTPSP